MLVRTKAFTKYLTEYVKLITYYEQNIYANINNFAAFIKIISVHSIT